MEDDLLLASVNRLQVVTNNPVPKWDLLFGEWELDGKIPNQIQEWMILPSPIPRTRKKKREMKDRALLINLSGYPQPFTNQKMNDV